MVRRSCHALPIEPALSGTIGIEPVVIELIDLGAGGGIGPLSYAGEEATVSVALDLILPGHLSDSD
jgi:hypothetical protein